MSNFRLRNAHGYAATMWEIPCLSSASYEVGVTIGYYWCSVYSVTIIELPFVI